MYRVVVGKYEGLEAGYIGEARRYGGIYDDPGPISDRCIRRRHR